MMNRRESLQLVGAAIVSLLAARAGAGPPLPGPNGEDQKEKNRNNLPKLKEPPRKPNPPERQRVFDAIDFQSLFDRIKGNEEKRVTPGQRDALWGIFNVAQDYLLSTHPESVDYAGSRERTGTQRTIVLKKGETYLYISACCQRPLNINLNRPDNYLPGFLEVKLVEGNPFSLDPQNVQRIIFSEDKNNFLGAETRRLDNSDLLNRIADGGAVDTDTTCPAPGFLNTNQLLGIRKTFSGAKFDKTLTEAAGGYLRKKWAVPVPPTNPSLGTQQA